MLPYINLFTRGSLYITYFISAKYRLSINIVKINVCICKIHTWSDRTLVRVIKDTIFIVDKDKIAALVLLSWFWLSTYWLEVWGTRLWSVVSTSARQHHCWEGMTFLDSSGRSPTPRWTTSCPRWDVSEQNICLKDILRVFLNSNKTLDRRPTCSCRPLLSLLLMMRRMRPFFSSVTRSVSMPSTSMFCRPPSRPHVSEIFSSTRRWTLPRTTSKYLSLINYLWGT